MSKKTTRSSKPKPDPDVSPQKNVVCAQKKVFYVCEKLLQADGEQQLRLERFHHPGKGQPALFITLEDRHIMELLEFSEPRRSWLLNSEVCSNGRTYLTTPIDATLLALHHLRKHCSQRAMSLESIGVDEPNASTNRLLTKFVSPESLKCVSDVKVSGGLTFYKYNAARALAWLTLKTRQVMAALRLKKVHCGMGAKSQNFVRSEKLAQENDVNDMDYMRMACDYVGRYLDADLLEQLARHLHIPSELQALAEEKAAAQKRKSEQGAQSANSKKIKLADGSSDAAAKLRNSSLLDDDDDAKENPTPPTTPAPPKERTLTAKEKSLAKSAKGSKSIASFFKVK
ncbi:hypothetical protein KR222_008349 [Zaprionus bogoriensis]|nr:hypothetical protein KR222_008349 [Zaprionus bogoriensis]